MIKTKNFNPMQDVKLLCTCGHPKCDKRSVTQNTLNRVQFIREDYGKPMVVTSGGRCPFHPNEINKSKPGDHQKGLAVDVYYEGDLDKIKLLVLAGRYGATRVAAGKNFIHMAWTPTKDSSVPTWEY